MIEKLRGLCQLTLDTVVSLTPEAPALTNPDLDTSNDTSTNYFVQEYVTGATVRASVS